MSIKENAQNVDTWTRGLFILVYGVIFYFVFWLVGLVVVFQFLVKLMTTELNQRLLDFSAALTRYIAQILLYITFRSEQRPFPFSPWPGAEVAEPPGPDDASPKTRKKKTTRKKIVKEKTKSP